MKLIIVLSLSDYRENVTNLLHEAGIRRFSTVDVTGFKDRREADELNWFSSRLLRVRSNSLLFFSFTEEEAAGEVVRQVSLLNSASDDSFPIHAFTVDVEKFSEMG